MSGGGGGGKPRAAAASASTATVALLFLLLSATGAGQDEDMGSGGGGDGIIVTEADLAALQAFRRALDDPGGVLRSWNGNNAAGACSGSWIGIKCVHGQVIAIQLPAKGLGGSISPRIGELGELRKLNLHSNRIGGPIPSSIASLPSLRGLYLFDNQLVGQIPPSLGSSPSLQAIDLSGNRLGGDLPASLGSSPRLLLLNVGDNNFTGSIPASWAAAPSLTSLVVAGNDLTGPIPDTWRGGPLRLLDGSRNRLTGNIPSSIANMTRLSTVDLSRNALNGTILPSIAGLPNLTSLDLSSNAFTGGIPAALSGAASLSALNVSGNKLTGRVPPLLATRFKSSSFEGNPGLCGYTGSSGAIIQCPSTPPPPRRAAPAPTTSSGGKKNRLSKVSLICIVVGGALALGAALCMLLLVAWRFREHRALGRDRSTKGKAESTAGTSDPSGGNGNGAGRLVHFDGPFTFTADDLLCATAEVMGKSTYGTVYKATLENGNSVVVKRLREGIVRSQREFEAEVGALGRIRHPNLVALRAYYWGPKDEKLLVYDFMNGGSLAAYLHARGPETPLGWSTRMRIALGAARGLTYLHDTEKMIHGNLTSSNILLDSQLEAAISDYGLSRLMTPGSTVLATAGSQGYRAPEVSKLKKGSTKSDVYSFGIVLLELLTGKAPGDAVSTGDGGALDLPEWVSSVVKEEWTSEVFDVELLKGTAPSEDDMLNTLQLAMNCVSATPSLRPDMSDVLRQLELVVASDNKKSSPTPSSTAAATPPSSSG